MAALIKIGFLLLCLLSPGLQASSTDAQETTPVPHEYTAIYRVERNDKEVGEITISLTRKDELWTLHGYTHDMHGLAKFLKIKGTQTSNGRWKDGRFMTEDFKIAFSLIGYKTGWTAEFDWLAEIVTIDDKGNKTELSLADGATDPFSLFLNIRSYLTENQTQVTLNIIDEDVIDTELYEVEPDERFDSALGCLKTTRFKRIRKNNKRTSMVWYADQYDHIPVLMHHSKRKGNKLELLITSLQFDGQQIEPGSSCN